MSYDETAWKEQTIKAATDMYRRDARSRAIATGVVAGVINDFGPIDPERIDRDVYEIATDVAIQILARIYTEDAEINALRIERDAYRKIAEDAIRLSPSPLRIFPQEATLDAKKPATPFGAAGMSR